MKTTTKVKKWGNSLGVRLTNAVAATTGITDDTEVEIVTRGRAITITPLKKQKKMTAEDLFEGVTPENVHGEIEWGPDIGLERWYDEA